ncbi:uncharacterized protein N7503_005594 [Penicillium pulvis]|uniref:uncharacterized protein n=1 Tax=Penicillium pulvis TaxID=1562058 RepID=UPI002546626E|nr:uncharacterized protein N7503_005594 [Penicillium pulvis]KAJ5803144.1 hypothetical protein N7503_005594 [Penicillium pulvis]
MNSLLAFCAGEVHRKQKTNSFVKYSNGNYGTSYYNQAIQKLCVALGNLNTSSATLESMVSSIFLLISYEMKFGSSFSNLQLHIDGIRSYLAKYLKPTLIEGLSSADQGNLHGPGVTPFCAQVLLWMAYIDVSGVRGLTTFRLYDFLDHDPTSCLHLDSLFPHARSSYRILYGETYPADQVQDDFENYRPVEMVHHNLRFRRRIWRVADAEENLEPCQDSTGAIWDDLIAFDRKYADLMSEHLVVTAYKGHRVIDTVRAAVSAHYANLILHRLLLTPSRPPLPMQRDALSKLVKIVHNVSNATECGVMIGWPWEPLIAGIETEDEIHRDWLKSYLKASGSLGKEFVWAGSVLEQVEKMRTKGEQIGGASRIRQLLHGSVM